MEALVLVATALALAVALPLGQAALASARWNLVIERDQVCGVGAYREAAIPRTRLRWSGIHPSVLAACTLGVLWAFATFCFAMAGAFLPPAWPVAISGFVLAIVLLLAVSRLARPRHDTARFVRAATTYSFVHHGAVLLTFLAIGALGSMELFAFTGVACTVGIAITAYLRASIATEVERQDLTRETTDAGHVAGA